MPLDSVQEFCVITNNFSAQYGRATGGIVNVLTKSGTNIFRGTGYEFFRNEKLSTNTPDNKANDIEKGQFKRNQPGFSIGGPIVKDKVHFFSSLEYIGVRSTDTLISLGADAAVPRGQRTTRPGRSSTPTAERRRSTVPMLTRGDVSAIVGRDGPAPSTSLPGGPAGVRPRREGAADRRRRRRPAGRLSVGQPRRLHAWATTRRCTSATRYQNQEAEPGTKSQSPYDGFDTGYLNKNHNILGRSRRSGADLHRARRRSSGTACSDDQPLNGDAAAALYMNPTTPVSPTGLPHRVPRLPALEPGQATFRSADRRSCCSSIRTRPGFKGKHDFRFGGSYVHIADDRTFGAYSNAVEALNTTRTRCRR